MRLSRSIAVASAALLVAALASMGPVGASAMPDAVTASNAAPAVDSLAGPVALAAVQQAQLTGANSSNEYFGVSVALSGDTALVGVPYEGDYSTPGSAYVFVRTGTTWSQQAKLTAADGANYDWFGSSVALSGDTAVVGARRDDVGSNSDQGSAYVFVRDGTSWSQQAKLTAADGAADGGLGASVALSGETALAAGGGSAYAFTRSGTSWSQQAKLTAADGTPLASVAISADTALAGAPWYAVGEDADQGAAYVFTRSDTIWSQQAQLLASDGNAGDNFGWSVAVSGDTALVGPQFHTVGANTNQGAAYVFTRSGTSWSQQAELTDQAPADYAQFGYSVALSGDTAVVGAPWDGGWGVPSAALGSASVFTRSGTSWSQQDTLTAADGAGGDRFGFSVALSGSTALVGAPFDDVGSPVSLIDQGSAEVFLLETDVTPPTTTLDVAGGTLGQNNWYIAAPTITLSANEPATTWYRWDHDVTDSEYTGGFAPPSGSHTLTYWSVDGSDNAEDPTTTGAFKLDTSKPTQPANVSAVQNGAGSALVTWSPASDDESGIQRYAVYSWNGSSYTTIYANIPPGSTSYTVNGLTVGAHSIAMKAINMAGLGSDYTPNVGFTISAPAGLTITPIQGDNRFETANAISRKAFPTGAGSVVIATGSNWPDALGGSALAGALDGPILLTAPTSLPDSVRTEIVRLGATGAYILGGESAVSTGVYRALDAIPGLTVQRIGGANRYETANKVAKRAIDVMKAGPGYDGTAFVATGANFPDALGASPLAAAKGWPIYLANPAAGNNAALVSTMNAVGVNQALVLGGTSVVSGSVATELKRVLGPTPVRLSGANRYVTAVQVAKYGISNAGLHWDKLAIATGQNFPDALAGGVLQGRDGSVMPLTTSASLSDEVAAALSANKASIHEVRFLGGTSAVSTSVRTAVSNLLK